MKTEILVKVLFIFVLAAGIGLVRLAGADPAEGAVPAGEGGAEGRVDLAETGTVTGTVHASDTGLPLPNMQVDANFFGYGFGACTDENGNYTLGDLPLNTSFKISAGGGTRCGNPALYAREYWQAANNWGDATVLSLTSSAPLTGVNMTLEPAGIITGTVYEADGQTPIANMGVDIATGGLGECTDENGHYTLILPYGPQKLRSGTYNFCSGGPSQYVGVYWPDQFNLDLATPITLSVVTPTVGGVDFILNVGGTVSGTVYAADGVTPLPNVNVDTDYFGYGFGGCTGPDGHFNIPGLPLDTNFKISAGGDNRCGNPVSFVREFWWETPDWDEALVLSLPASSPQQSNITFTLQVGGTVTGTVYAMDGLTPLPNVNVGTAFFGYGYGGCSDATGHFSISNLPLDRDFVISAGGDHSCGNPVSYIRQYWQHTTDWNEATRLRLTGGAPVQGNITFTLEAGATMTGLVTDDEEHPLADVRVSLTAPGYPDTGACTDSNGVFTIEGLVFDRPLYLTAGGNQPNVCGNQGYLYEFYPNALFESQAQGFTFTRASPVISGTHVYLEPLSSGGTISGRITDSLGRGVSSVSANIYRLWDAGDASDYESSYGRWVSPDANGYYTLPVPFGTYSVTTSGDPYASLFWKASGGVNSYPGRGDPIDVSAGQPHVTGINFTQYRAGTVSGKVTDDQGNPLPFVTVQFYFPFTGIGFNTDAAGQYSQAVPFLDVPFTAVSPTYEGYDPLYPNYTHQWWDHSYITKTTLSVTTVITELNNIDFVLEVDHTPPTITIEATTALDNSPYLTGTWTHQSVVVRFICRDADSRDRTCPNAQTIESEGVTAVVSGTASDRAGNSATAYFGPIWIDKTPPVFSSCPATSLYTASGPQTAGPIGAGDTLSGIDAGLSQLTRTVEVTSTGAVTVTFSAVDQAGNLATQDCGFPVVNPVPSLASLTPPSVDAGSGGLTLTLGGAKFVAGATASWGGVGLTTTFVSSATLTVTLPAEYLTAAGTVTLTVSNPGPGGGVSGPAPFFVTTAPVTVTGQIIGSGTNPTVTVGGSGPATPGSVSAAAGGTGTLVISQFNGDPGSAVNFQVASPDTFFDVFVAPASTFVTLTLTVCNLQGGEQVRWDDGSGAWPAVAPQSAVVDGCITLSLSDASSPTIAQLTGTAFGVVADQTAPTINADATKADHTVYMTGTWTNQAVTVRFTCLDNLNGSGIPPGACPADQVFDATGVLTATATVTDTAGNGALPVSYGPVQVDLTQPVISVTATNADQTPYFAGTVTTQTVTVHFSCSDADSGVATCPADVVVSAAGVTPSVSGTAWDNAGNSRQASFGPIEIGLVRVYLPLVRR